MVNDDSDTERFDIDEVERVLGKGNKTDDMLAILEGIKESNKKMHDICDNRKSCDALGVSGCIGCKDWRVTTRSVTDEPVESGDIGQEEYPEDCEDEDDTESRDWCDDSIQLQDVVRELFIKLRDDLEKAVEDLDEYCEQESMRGRE